MKASAIKYIREHKGEDYDITIQTVSQYYYIHEAKGVYWELLEDIGLLAIHKGHKTEFLDIDHIVDITEHAPEPK